MDKDILAADSPIATPAGHRPDWAGGAAALALFLGLLANFTLLSPGLLSDPWWWRIAGCVILVAAILLTFFPRLFDVFFLCVTLAGMELASLKWMRTTLNYHLSTFIEFGDQSMRGNNSFVDMFSPYGPVMENVFGWVMRFFGPTYINIQVATIFVSWLGLVGLYFAGRRLMPRWAAAWACVLYIFLLCTVVIPWPNYFAGTATLLFAIFLFFAIPGEGQSCSRKHVAFLFAAGLVSGLLPWIRQQGIFPLLIGFLSWVLIVWLRRMPGRRIVRTAAILGGGILVSGGGIFLTIVLRGGYDQFLAQYVHMAPNLSPGASTELALPWPSMFVAVLRRIFNPLQMRGGGPWEAPTHLFVDYGLLLLILLLAVAVPFWKRFVISQSDSAATITRGDILCFLLGMILSSGVSSVYPEFTGFRIASALSGGVVVAVYWICCLVHHSGIRRRMAWSVPVVVVLVLCCFIAQRASNWSYAALASLREEYRGYPGLVRSASSPAMRGMYLPPRIAAEEAALSYVLDKYEEMFPGTPILSDMFFTDMSPFLLVGRPGYAKPALSRLSIAAPWAKEMREKHIRETGDFLAKHPSLIVGPNMALRQKFAAAKDYQVLYAARGMFSNYRWGAIAPIILAPEAEATQFREQSLRVFSLSKPGGLGMLRDSAMAVLGEENGALVIRRAGEVALDFMVESIGERYQSVVPWLVVGLDGDAWNESGPTIELSCSRSGAAGARFEQPLRRPMRFKNKTTFFRLTRAGPERWRIMFPESAVGLRLTTMDLYAVRPETLIPRFAATDANGRVTYTTGQNSLGGEKRPRWSAEMTKPIEVRNIRLGQNGLAVFGMAFQKSGGPAVAGDEIEVVVDIASDKKKRQVIFRVPMGKFDAWLDREFDLSDFAGETVALRFTARQAGAAKRFSGTLHIEEGVMIYGSL